MAAPSVKFVQFSSSGVNPSGSRHVTTHLSYIKQLAASGANLLDFGTVSLANNINYSPTKAVLFRVSNMNGGSRVENMRFWLAKTPAGITNVSYNFATFQKYASGCALTNASGQIPLGITTQNIYRTDGHAAISGITDSEVSQWIYLNIGCSDAASPGVYGGKTGGLAYRMTFDYL